MYDDLPPSLKGMKDFLFKADQFQRPGLANNPVVAHHCRVFALEFRGPPLNQDACFRV